MRGKYLSSVLNRSFLVIALFYSSVIGRADAQPLPGVQAPPPADTLTTKDGKSISGRITSMQDGKITVSTGQGPTTLEIEKVAGFEIRAGGGAAEQEPAIDPETIEQIVVGQQQILQRLDALAVAFSNLEQQLRSVQTNQVIQSRRLTERTLETDPVAKVVVVNSNITRRGNEVVVVGQVMNQSESVVTGLQVQTTLLGSAGKLGAQGGADTKTGPVFPQTLGPGQLGNFEISYSGSYVVENFRVNVVGFPGQFQFPAQALPQGFGDY